MKYRLILLVALGMAAQSSALGQIVIQPPPPIPTSRPQPYDIHNCSYPLEAIASRASGRTELSFQITRTGNVRAVVIAKSSGDVTLDRAAAACVLRWPYVPARVKGKFVEMPVRAAVVWSPRTKQEGPLQIYGPQYCSHFYSGDLSFAHSNGETVLDYRVEKNGKLSHARVLKSSGNSRLDAASVDCTQKLRSAHSDGESSSLWKIAVEWPRPVKFDDGCSKHICIP